MKKEIAFSIFLLLLGFICEWFYLYTESTFLGVKLYLLGAFSIIFGLIGLLLYGLLPIINDRLDD